MSHTSLRSSCWRKWVGIYKMRLYDSLFLHNFLAVQAAIPRGDYKPEIRYVGSFGRLSLLAKAPFRRQCAQRADLRMRHPSLRKAIFRINAVSLVVRCVVILSISSVLPFFFLFPFFVVFLFASFLQDTVPDI